MTSPYIILHALLTRILSQIKFIVCVAAFPLPKKFRVQPSFFGSPFYINIICVVCSYVRDIKVADCRWQSFCDLTESADESRPLHRQRSLCLLEFYHDKIHRLRRGVSSFQKISGITLIFLCISYIFIICISFYQTKCIKKYGVPEK